MRNLKIAMWIILFSISTSGVGSAKEEIVEANICDLVNRPQQYSGHLVKFAAVWTRSARRILVDDPDGKCGPILVELPTDSDVHPHAHFSVVKDAELEKFLQSAFVLIPNAKTHQKGRIRATLQGRFDVALPGKGFGHGGLYGFRLVLQQASRVSVEKREESANSVEPQERK